MIPIIHPIAKPNQSKSYSARPQTIQRFLNKDTYQKARLSRPISIDHIDVFLEKELSKTHSVSDKMFVYQRAFDLLIKEFQICRPLLERIKKQYDKICSDLISRKLEITTNTTSVSYAEDSFSETINELRRTKTIEFAQTKIESENLLDYMTELRLKRSELLEHLNILTKKDLELTETETSTTSQINEFTSKRQESNEAAKELENICKDQIETIQILNDDIEKTNESSVDIHQHHQQVIDEFSVIDTEINKLNQKIEQFSIDCLTKTKEIEEIERNNELLSFQIDKKQNELIKLSQTQNELEIRLRSLLKNHDIDPFLPIDEILNQLQAMQ